MSWDFYIGANSMWATFELNDTYRVDQSILKALLFETVFCLANKYNRSGLQCLGRSHPYSDWETQ